MNAMPFHELNLRRNDWQPAAHDAKRSPCPAINSLANHGFIPRSGKDVGWWRMIYALHTVYGMTYPFAVVLVTSAMLGIGKKSWRGLTIDLDVLCNVAHVGALVQNNPKKGHARNKPSISLVQELLAEAPGEVVTLENLCTFRNEREQSMPPVPFWAQGTAQGELGLMLQVFGDEDLTCSKDVVESFLHYQRLHESFTGPRRYIGLHSTITYGVAVHHEQKKLASPKPLYISVLHILLLVTFALFGSFAVFRALTLGPRALAHL